MSDPLRREIDLADARRMATLRTGEADLCVTSPPYFSAVTEARLRRPRKEQTEPAIVASEVARFAATLAPVFRELRRVMRVGGWLVVQTKDLRYGGRLVELAALHARLATRAGFVLVSRVYWRKTVERRRPSQAFLANPAVGAFRADDVEEWQIFAAGTIPPAGSDRVALEGIALEDLTCPLWTLPSLGAAKTHPFQAPPSVVRRFIALLSRPGDLVIDPFAGHGTTLVEALRLGRNAVGYDIDPECVAKVERRLEKP